MEVRRVPEERPGREAALRMAAARGGRPHGGVGPEGRGGGVLSEIVDHSGEPGAGRGVFH